MSRSAVQAVLTRCLVQPDSPMGSARLDSADPSRGVFILDRRRCTMVTQFTFRYHEHMCEITNTLKPKTCFVPPSSVMSCCPWQHDYSWTLLTPGQKLTYLLSAYDNCMCILEYITCLYDGWFNCNLASMSAWNLFCSNFAASSVICCCFARWTNVLIVRRFGQKHLPNVKCKCFCLNHLRI